MTNSVLEKIRQDLNSYKNAPPPASLLEARANFETARTRPERVLTGTLVEPVSAAGVPAEWVSTPGVAPATAGVILYLHGGAYIQGSPNTHRPLVAWLGQSAGLTALSIDYRLAPEHPFPAALDDALTAYHWLISQSIPPSKIILAGDSAGGGLALTVLLSLRDNHETLPAAAVLLSPWTDLTCSGDSFQALADRDPMMNAPRLAGLVRAYTTSNDPHNPLLSPVYADLTGLPPLLIHVGSDEILLDDATRLAANATTAAVPVEITIYPQMWHVFQAYALEVEEARQSIQQIGHFIRASLNS